MNEEFELITVTISLAATAMNENNCRTATGKPAFSAVMQSMSRHVILPRAFGKEGRNYSTLCVWNKISFALFHFSALAWGQRCLFRLGLGEQAFFPTPHKRKVWSFFLFSPLISTTLPSIFWFSLRFIYRRVWMTHILVSGRGGNVGKYDSPENATKGG